MKNLKMDEDSFVYDTYALVEIIEGNENYRDYLDKNIQLNGEDIKKSLGLD